MTIYSSIFILETVSIVNTEKSKERVFIKWGFQTSQDLEMSHCVAHLSTSSHRQSTSVQADEKTLYGQNFKTFYSQTIILLLQQSH